MDMPELGFALSSEDHEPRELVRQAALAERSGFTFCTISDHYHPWLDRQGHSGFVWSTLGGIAHAIAEPLVYVADHFYRAAAFPLRDVRQAGIG